MTLLNYKIENVPGNMNHKFSLHDHQFQAGKIHFQWIR